MIPGITNMVENWLYESRCKRWALNQPDCKSDEKWYNVKMQNEKLTIATNNKEAV